MPDYTKGPLKLVNVIRSLQSVEDRLNHARASLADPGTPDLLDAVLIDLRTVIGALGDIGAVEAPAGSPKKPGPTLIVNVC